MNLKKKNQESMVSYKSIKNIERNKDVYKISNFYSIKKKEEN